MEHAPASSSALAAAAVGKRTFDSLEAMMAAYAAEAVRIACEDYRETLDYRPASLGALERILNRLSPAPATLDPSAGEMLTLVWGSYFGEVLRLQFSGEWTMSLYPKLPGSAPSNGQDEFAVPTIVIAGSRLYPLLKVHRRLTLGAAEDVEAFYAMIADRLSTPRPG